MHEDGCKQCLIVFVLVLVAVQRAQLDNALQEFSAEFLRLCTNTKVTDILALSVALVSGKYFPRHCTEVTGDGGFCMFNGGVPHTSVGLDDVGWTGQCFSQS